MRHGHDRILVGCGEVRDVVFEGRVFMVFFLMRRRPPRSTQSRSSAASDVYKRQMSMRRTVPRIRYQGV